ncbi:autotransporter outer membrane beta-barrel domain-containing protein [Stenotrophomonas sp. PS02289]|uniref:autotransporter outer membrane beta-barrel domain-containing protein n=1 Tax=Stenotrophomonas sp. PS02289 TaxID=2991422 RepID=UPI00249B813E|nr:autotransporter outer membrane beta-barrel domain-containing protein [Stenotrophomonas sp. PS02289]
MNVSHGSRRPSLRPLASAVLLALSTLPLHSAVARDIDGERVDVGYGQPAEEWKLINTSHLSVNNGQTHYISATDTSLVQLADSTVTRTRTTGPAIFLSGKAELFATSTRILGGGITLSNSAYLEMTGSEIVVDRAGGADVGLLMLPTGYQQALLDSTRIHVLADPAAPTGAGIGARLAGGELRLQNKSEILSTNAGVHVLPASGFASILTIDDSSVTSQQGPALWVAAQGDKDQRVDITVSNGSTLSGGDGNLLLARALNGQPGEAHTDVQFTVTNAHLTGDVTLDTTAFNGSINVGLFNNARVTGRFNNVTTARISSGSTWQLSGDSTVGQVQLDSTGDIELGDGMQFNTLSMDSFAGNGGTLVFNTRLGDDTSATDRLFIAGKAEGQANVIVRNAGGAGAKTDRGIELIRIDGNSNAMFHLLGRAVGGRYEYFLLKDESNGNWYLSSELTSDVPCDFDPNQPGCEITLPVEPIEPIEPIDPVDPIEPVDPVEPIDPVEPVDPTDPIKPVDPADPADPITPTPVLRPEAGAYLANQFAMEHLLRHSWRDRQGEVDGTGERPRGWARVDSTQSRLGKVHDQLTLRVERSRLQLGADLSVFDDGRGRLGLMGTAAQSSANSRSELTGYSARGRVEGGAVGAYAGWSNGTAFMDSTVQRGQFRNRVQGEGLAEERYSSDIWQSSLEGGYRIGISQLGVMALSLQPELQLVYTDISTDLHVESNGTVVRAVGNDGVSGRLGLRLQGNTTAAVGVQVQPYLAANWYRDGGAAGVAFDDEVLNAGTPRNRYELTGGGRVDVGSLSGWGGVGVSRGDQGYREVSAQLGLSYRW